VSEAHVVVTGATGFVGKVVLEQLVRRRAELGIASIALIVRTPNGSPARAADGRLRSIVASPLFAAHPVGWAAIVTAVPGDLAQPRCGLADDDHRALIARTTHVIHCAASVEFDLPIAEAATANVTTALEALELARGCPRLVRMVAVSTAYVHAWRSGPLDEQLARLPRPAGELLAAIRGGAITEAELLAETGHPNTYTLTKCVAEHLIAEQRGAVPVAIVRPSIVSAAWRSPMPGWIDSAAALAGCLLYTGLGVVRAWNADPDVRLDVVPVDLVADTIVAAAFAPTAADEPLAIHHATMGIEHALRIDLAVDATTRFFRERPGAKRWPALFVGTADQGFARADLVRRELPLHAARAALAITRRTRDRRKLDKADARVRYLNAAFGYFTHHTFEFRRSRPLALAGFTPSAYLEVVLHGMYRHLVRKDETQEPFAGASHDDARDDLAWARGPERDANATTRVLALGLRVALRRGSTGVTFDRPAFERALAAVPAGAVIVLAPSHRSYLDFLLTSYLCFQHPELGVPVPHIAAAEEFGQIPIVGRLLRGARAFYLQRGVGREAPALSDELRRLSARDASLMFFVEGQRSRSRLVLSPKRGLLRGLQATGRTFAVLPIAIAYDRLPEEQALERELAGGARSKMRLGPLLAWLDELVRGRVALGRIHLACGALQVLEPASDVHAVSRAVVAEHQRHMAISQFHIRAFLAEAALDPALAIDETWLTAAIRARGGRVVASSLAVPAMTAPFAQSLRNQWMHWFYGDAVARYPHSVAVTDHVQRNAWFAPARVTDIDPRAAAVVDALMAPIADAYRATVTRIGAPGTATTPVAYPRPADLVRAYPAMHLPHVEDAYRALAEREIVRAADVGYLWGANARAASQVLVPGPIADARRAP